MQIAAAVSADDVVHGDFHGVVSVGSLRGSSRAVAVGTPADGSEAMISTETVDECSAREICIDEYLWSVYQRAPKEDTIKVVERRKVTVEVDGKARTISKEFTTLVDEDFTWKDPKAAEKAGISLKEYVIGGMDRDFKLKLYYALRAMDDAGLSPGITSAFRDDHRQSLASGLKAATNRSFHGGSLRGGYGHGLAADIVSVNGETRAQRFISSESLWKWIDAHGTQAQATGGFAAGAARSDTARRPIPKANSCPARRPRAGDAPAPRHVAPRACPQVPGFRTLHRPDRSREGQRVDRAAAPDRPCDPLRLAISPSAHLATGGISLMGKLVLAAKVTHVPSLMLSEVAGSPLKSARENAVRALRELGRRARSAASRPSSCSTRTGCPISATISTPIRIIGVRSRATKPRT